MTIKKGDNVIVLTGKYKGMTGKVTVSLPSRDKVVIEGINISKRHQRPRKEGQKGSIVEKAMPIHVSNVALATESRTKKVSKK